MKQLSDNEIYLLIKYIKSFLWRVAKRLSYVQDARCLKVKQTAVSLFYLRYLSCIVYKLSRDTSFPRKLQCRSVVTHREGIFRVIKNAINFPMNRYEMAPTKRYDFYL